MSRRRQQINIDLAVQVSLPPRRQLNEVAVIGEECNEIGIGENPAAFSYLGLCGVDPLKPRDKPRRRPGVVSQMLEDTLVEARLPPCCPSNQDCREKIPASPLPRTPIRNPQYSVTLGTRPDLRRVRRMLRGFDPFGPLRDVFLAVGTDGHGSM